ncbi:helix-turn-helix domain-containing protein [Nocardioides zeae]|uniref:PucR family transcriptional regulator n=1 Tax=Nocardioides zeae TaxID=1457234 RepID=A0A6P0HFM5_9ACTN|nr:PucR family transcriptional regulator [Nocardioides zeae]
MVDGDAAPCPLARAHGLAPGLATAYRPRVPAFSRRLADEVVAVVAGFAHPTLRPVVDEAVALAVTAFVDALAGASVRTGELARHFDRLGRLEAAAGHDLDAMQAAHQVATQQGWSELRRRAAELATPPALVDRVTDVLLAYQRWLHDQAVRGYVEEQRTAAPRVATEEPRTRLFAALLAGASPTRLGALAQEAGLSWPPPGPLVAVVTETVQGAARAAQVAAVEPFREDLLAGVLRGRAVLVVAQRVAADVAAALAHRGRRPVALGWGGEPDEVPHGVRWAVRALRLVRSGVIALPPDGVVRCAEHRETLWLHADEALLEQVTSDLLAPLDVCKPAQRDALAETLLAWLQTRGSAPVLAEQLGVHHQTVRHRMRRLRDLLGEAVDDPAMASVLLPALHAERARAGARSG